MSIFPLIYWKIIAKQTNKYAEWRMEQQFLKNNNHTVSGANQEIIHFYGMLNFMCLFPLPGATYTTYGEYGSPMFLWTTMMQLRRFTPLRSVLHFNSNNADVPGKDTLHKTRPLLNILKKTMGAFIIPGSELALDEASAVSQSNFGGNIIFTMAKNPPTTRTCNMWTFMNNCGQSLLYL
jgi:hypothetical protein